jgi:Tfp pilus assembly protein PilF
MCADCHSTNLKKNYDLASKTYKTTWSEIDVSCESCHGPASSHLAWAKKKNPAVKDKGLSINYAERKKVSWHIDAATGNAKRSKIKNSNTEIEACAQCHSRRLTSFPNARPEHALLDNFRVSLLTEPQYHADGQINDEVYVYGSFVQSKMYHAGVTCSDCHQPHTLKLRAQGNSLCAKCHSPGKYDTSDHHMHKLNTDGAQCVNCHMPSKNYMVVDPRRDHSFRKPRPDLTVKLGVPNACANCHTDKSAQWAAKQLEKKYGKPEPHYGEAIYAGRNGLPGSASLLAELTLDKSKPAIVRATAVTLLERYLSGEIAPVLQAAANDEQPLVGLGLAEILDAIPTQRRTPFAFPLLYDDSRITRALAARSMLGISLQGLPAEGQKKYNQAIEEYKTSQLFNADRPESLANLAGLYAEQGDIQQAKQYYRDAIKLAPYYTPAYINLADLYRGAGDESAAEATLREALTKVRDKTAIQHTLGLVLVRKKQLSEAVDYLRSAAESPTTTDRYIYVYAIALNSSGQPRKALQVLEQALSRYPANADILYALVSINREIGDDKRAKYFENKIHELGY